MTLVGHESYVTNWKTVEALQPRIRGGDIVEMKRSGGDIHSGIYIGNGMLIHISVSKSTGKIAVVEESLGDAACEDRVRVNNDTDRKFPPLSEETIVGRAKDHVGVTYRIGGMEETSRNFSIMCRYGGSRVEHEGWG